MRDDRPRGRAPDYTDAALVMGAINLIWVLMVVWAAVGYWAVLAICYGLNLLITRFENSRCQGD